MTCSEFQQWLDEGRPRHELARMKEHVACCSRCEGELRAALEVERLLSFIVSPETGADFNDGVMRRLRTTPLRGWRRLLAACVDVVAEPFVPVSIAVAVVIAWQQTPLSLAAAAMSNRMVRMSETLSVQLLSPQVSIGLSLAFAPLLLLLTWLMFRTEFGSHLPPR